MTLEGIQIEDPAWEVSGNYSLAGVLRALTLLAPDGAILYLERGHASDTVAEFLISHTVQQPTLVYPGTIAPKPLRAHVPATAHVLSLLAAFAEPEDVYDGEICDHMVLYLGKRVLLSGYDFGSLPLLLDRDVPEATAREFAARSGGEVSATAV